MRAKKLVTVTATANRENKREKSENMAPLRCRTRPCQTSRNTNARGQIAAKRAQALARTAPTLTPHSAMQKIGTTPCKVEWSKKKKALAPGFEPCPQHLAPHPPSRSSNKSFLYRRDLQPYLIRVNMEEYLLINDSLVSTIMS
jgi:hypothetical protein